MDMAMDLAIVGTWNFRDPNKGFTVSHHGRFLLVANNDTACVCRYAIAEDGRLTLREGTVSVPNAANIGMLFFD